MLLSINQNFSSWQAVADFLHAIAFESFETFTHSMQMEMKKKKQIRFKSKLLNSEILW